MKFKIVSIIILVLSAVSSVLADEEIARRTYIVTNTYGNYYAKSVPEQGDRSSGITSVYTVEKEKDRLDHVYDFYSDNIFISGTSIAAFGPWSRGIKPSNKDIALAFYGNGKIIKSYTTADIYALSKEFRRSVSHYDVFKSINGVKDLHKNQTYSLLSVTLYNDQEVLFNISNGRIISFENNLPVYHN